MRTHLIHLALFTVLATAATACGTDTPTAAPTAPAPGSTTAPTPSGPSTSTAPGIRATAPAHGLIVAWENYGTGMLEIGLVDPATGRYTRENRFHTGTPAKGVNVPDLSSSLQFQKMVSPDRTRVLVSRSVDGDGHAGWLDTTGAFTDVTAAILGKRSDFSGPVSSGSEGFDAHGRFYYTVETTGAKQVFAVEPGTTSNPTLVYSTSGLFPRRVINRDGVIDYEAPRCLLDADAWIGGSFLESTGTQIDRIDLDPSGESCITPGTPLLPSGNSARVSSPVPSPDGTQVAFVYENRDRSRAIYVVDADGGGNARKIDPVQWPDESARLVGWA